MNAPAPLVLGIPSKGRLQDATSSFFDRCGLPIKKFGGARDYRGFIDGVEGVEVAFLSASEIAGELAAGSIHLGVTGMDLVGETIADPDAVIEPLLPLGFGYADVVVAVPDSWIDVQTMHDLEEVAAGFRARHGRRMRLATKYVGLTRRFFRSHGVIDYRIVESLGATEGAPAAGAADLIVDITTSGATLAANHLRVLSDGTILKSEATLIAAIPALWSDETRAALQEMLGRISATTRAAQAYEVRTAIAEQAKTSMEAAELFDATAPFGAVGGQGILTLHVPRAHLWAAIEFLKSRGGASISVHEPAFVADASVKVFDKALDRLGG